ncbi:MAG: glycosyltransferase family 2 protein [Microthrixaceae bacterium]
MLQLSVVICTLDRAPLLAGCLDAVVADRPLDGTVEVIVVDNGSTDHTAAVVAARPSVVYVREGERGLSRARNAGLSVAQGALVAFLDDDARPEPGWCAALLAARGRWPDVAAIGGPVGLQWDGPRPKWLKPELTRWLSWVDHGPSPRMLRADEQIVGANLAVARADVLRVGGFSPELGRVGSSLASAEEVDLVRRLRLSGGEVGWEPNARVRHLVPRERMRRRWLLRRAWAQGRSDAVAARLAGVEVTSRWRPVVWWALRGWSETVRNVRAAPDPQLTALKELLRRARGIGQAIHSRD